MARSPEGFLAAPAPGGATKRGLWPTYFIDISNNQGSGVNLRQVAHNSRKTGITCVEMKASEGTGYVDQFFHQWRDEARQWGLRSFAYHFARPDQNPTSAGARREADHFCDVVGKVRDAEWRPMLDFETGPFKPEWVRAWNLRVYMRLGVWPTLYSYWSALVGLHLSKPLSAGLIFAYPNEQPKVAPCPPPWKHWQAHQYSWHGHVAGIPGEVDLNWTPNVWPLLAKPIIGAAYEPVFAARRRKA